MLLPLLLQHVQTVLGGNEKAGKLADAIIGDAGDRVFQLIKAAQWLQVVIHRSKGYRHQSACKMADYLAWLVAYLESSSVVDNGCVLLASAREYVAIREPVASVDLGKAKRKENCLKEDRERETDRHRHRRRVVPF